MEVKLCKALCYQFSFLITKLFITFLGYDCSLTCNNERKKPGKRVVKI